MNYLGNLGACCATGREREGEEPFLLEKQFAKKSVMGGSQGLGALGVRRALQVWHGFTSVCASSVTKREGLSRESGGPCP